MARAMHDRAPVQLMDDFLTAAERTGANTGLKKQHGLFQQVVLQQLLLQID